MARVLRGAVPAHDQKLEPEARLLIAVFRQARIDLFSASDQIRTMAERFLASYGYDVEEIRACWKR
jgi:hypothetical protein